MNLKIEGSRLLSLAGWLLFFTSTVFTQNQVPRRCVPQLAKTFGMEGLETPEAVANADAIAAVPGVDVLMFGTSDLTATMGIPGQIGHPDVRKAYETVGAACAKHGKFMGMGGVYDEKVAPDYIKLGARFILSGSDHSFLMAGASARSKFLRGLA